MAQMHFGTTAKPCIMAQQTIIYFEAKTMSEHKAVVQNHRFSKLVKPTHAKCGDLAAYDTKLFENDEFVVVPTLGSIIPYWILVVPTSPAINMQIVSEKSGRSPLLQLEKLADKLDIATSDMIWFEHGASSLNSQTGCGVDYAHLHVLLAPSFKFSDFTVATFTAHHSKWDLTNSDVVYETIAPKMDYYVFGSGSVAFVERTGRSLGSQFFRKVIANLSGQDSAWDYKLHAFDENVSTTIDLFKAERKVAA
jgi:ATP adenylyltransferase